MKRRYYLWLSRHENVHGALFYLHLAKSLDPQPKNGWESYIDHSLTHDKDGL